MCVLPLGKVSDAVRCSLACAGLSGDQHASDSKGAPGALPEVSVPKSPIQKLGERTPMAVRVAHNCTGNTGREALGRIIQRPDLELTVLWVTNPRAASRPRSEPDPVITQTFSASRIHFPVLV